MLLVSDRPLLDGFRAGTPAALKTVYLHYRPRVSGFLHAGFGFNSSGRHLRFRGYSSPSDLDTATQETFARAFIPQARMAYDGLRPYLDYLLAIARNHVLNELRRAENLVLVGGSEDVEPLAAQGASQVTAERTLEEREVERVLAEFLGRASDIERRLFDLRFRDELGQEAAAASLGFTRIQVRRIELKLKRRLLEHLKSSGYLTDVGSELLGVGLRAVLL